MQEHVCYKLPKSIVFRTEMVQGKKVFYRQQIPSNGHLGKPNQRIDDNEVFNNYGEYLEAARSNF
jgi:hypothetical protein